MDKRKEKHEVLAEYFAGGISTRKLAVKYGYSKSTVLRWIMSHKKYGKSQPAQVLPAGLTAADMPTRVEELQEALRISRLKVDLLEAMIAISDAQFGTNIRKKAGTSQS